MQNKNYNLKDSANIFLMALVIPNVIAFFVVLMFVAIMGQEAFESSKIYIVLSLCLNQVIFLIIYLLHTFTTKKTIKESKICNKISIKTLLVVILIAFASFILLSPFANVLDELFQKIGFNGGELPIKMNSFKNFAFLFLTLGVFAPIVEELIFRGVIFNGLKKQSTKFAVLISSLMFMLIHLSINQSIYQFLMGIVLALAVLYTNSLISSILIHFINNSTILLINYIIPNLTNVNYLSVHYIIIAVVLLILGAVSLYFCFKLLKKVSKYEKAKESVCDNESKRLLDNEQMLNLVKEKKDKQYVVFSLIVGAVIWIFSIISVII